MLRIVALCCLVYPSGVLAQSTSASQSPSSPDTPPAVEETVTVSGTPLEDIELPIDAIPAPVQVATADAIDRSGALDLSSFIAHRMNGVHVNDVQNNPFQPDVNYRGYTASPLLGTPQGLSVYMDGVRMNQPFGDVVSWDLVPRAAIASIVLMPGSNPLFGMNTLGGALSVRTKSGLTHPGTTVHALYGRDARRAVEFEHGGVRPNGLHWFLAGNAFAEEGWREDSSSDVRQIFGKVGWQNDMDAADLSLSHVDNSLFGNGLQEMRMLELDRESVYTKPDETRNRATFLNASWRRRHSEELSVAGQVYYRRIGTDTLNGDINEESLDQALYQPNADERAALFAAGYTGVPASGESAANTPFPSWRCIANVLLNDEPSEKCNGLINRGNSVQHNGGLSAQITRIVDPAQRRHQLTAGFAYDDSRMRFAQNTELGYLNPDRSITGLGAFGDGETGGEADGEPFDTRVDLHGRVRTLSLFGVDTMRAGSNARVTLSARFNRTTVTNVDQLLPDDDERSLSGRHVFSRVNPAAGVTFDVRQNVSAYVGYSEGSRAATSIELGCANPEQPCKLPNAMAGDPPLEQVITRTVEAGIRYAHAGVTWNAGVFLARNRDDILFVASEQTGFGYFRNFGRTQRRGVEMSTQVNRRAWSAGVSYTYLNATYGSPEVVGGAGNSTNEDAEEGMPGMEGVIDIEPGDRMPLIPAHQFKMFAEAQLSRALSLDVELSAVSSSFARGNENHKHEPDGMFYLGPGTVPGYAVVNLAARYQFRPRVQLVGQVRNLFDRQYATAAQLGPTGFTESGTFEARPFPAINGEFPRRSSTFYAPGAPRAWTVELRMTF